METAAVRSAMCERRLPLRRRTSSPRDHLGGRSVAGVLRQWVHVKGAPSRGGFNGQAHSLDQAGGADHRRQSVAGDSDGRGISIDGAKHAAADAPCALGPDPDDEAPLNRDRLRGGAAGVVDAGDEPSGRRPTPPPAGIDHRRRRVPAGCDMWAATPQQVADETDLSAPRCEGVTRQQEERAGRRSNVGVA